MNKIWSYLVAYSREQNKWVFVLTALFSAIGIFINYYFSLDPAITALPRGQQFIAWYAVFLAAFSFPYVLLVFTGKNPFRHARFVLLLLLAPCLFAWKMYYDPDFSISADARTNAYWNKVLYYPFKLLVLIFVLGVFWWAFNRRESFYGFTANGFDTKPYLMMLLIMLPLIAAASTQPDFLAMYPKLKTIGYFTRDHPQGWYKLLYELSYGIDFVGIELYFRGFLILAFVKWAGKDTILPMACFYCTIHYGKPLGECISSFFGGIVLGVVTYHTRTILGGLMVHLGIAWMMELGGYLGTLIVDR
jgi:hypothetical protein